MPTDGAAGLRTGICLEKPADDNPFVARERYIMGYRLDDLWRRTRYVDALLMMWRGHWSSAQESAVFESLLIGLMNLGPRHPAIRAAMTAAVSKSAPEHLLSIGLLTGSGIRGGALEAQLSYQFLDRHMHTDPQACAAMYGADDSHGAADAEMLEQKSVTPGFGSCFGQPDPILQRLATHLGTLWPDCPTLSWCQKFTEALMLRDQGWLAPGLVAAVCRALGIGARETMAVYQLAIAPGIAAQALEQTHQPIAASPLLADDCYEYRP